MAKNKFKINSNIIIKEPIITTASMVCGYCKEQKAVNSFIKDYSDIDEPAKYLPYCKKCIRALCNDESKEMNLGLSIQILQKFNKPYKHEIWKQTLEGNKKKEEHIISYLKQLTVENTGKLGWKDGDLNYLIKEKYIQGDLLDSKTDNEDVQNQDENRFKVTEQILNLFGNGFTYDEYNEMWNKYNFLNKNYAEQTSMHTEALITYVRYKVKEEMAIAKGDAQEAKTWGELAMKQADKAKINPYQLSKADLQGGLTTIGEIVQAVEQNEDIIPILPQFRYRPNDAVDFCIWNYINYARSLEGKPLIEYEEVYQFYDVQKQNYIDTTGDPYGIFDKDETEKNREKIKTFIKPFEEEA